MVRNSAIRTGDLVRMGVRTNEWPPSRPSLYCIRLGVIHASPKRSIETNTHPLRKGERRSISLQDSAMPGENCRVDHDTVSGDIGDAARQPVSNSGDAPAHESSSQAAGEGIADESLHDVGARTRHVGVSRCPGPASRSGRRTDQHCWPSAHSIRVGPPVRHRPLPPPYPASRRGPLGRRRCARWWPPMM